MDKPQKLDRERIDAITRYVEANRDRLAESARALMRDDDGDPLPFVLLLPTGNGSLTIANMPDSTARAMLRVVAEQLEQEALRQMFVRGIVDAMARMVQAGGLEPVDDDDDSGKVH